MLSALSHVWSRVRGRPARAVPRRGGELLGTEYGGYAVQLDELDANSVVYSFGIGTDLSFDRALIERTRATVHAFDPTPRAVAWAREQAVPGVVIHEYGLLDRDGVVHFNRPRNPEHISHSVLDERVSDRISEDAPLELPVKRLHTVMRELSHGRVDVLKMDIEGAEYAMIDDLVKEPVDVGQILLEFHHMLPGVTVGRTERAIDQLAELGFVPFWASKTGREWSFSKRP
jgi:FkbM family methyltransferase